MYERFSDRARKVMQLAQQEAHRFNHSYVGSEHILLGLIKEGNGVGACVLKNLNVDLRRVLLEVEKIVQPGPEMVTHPQDKLPMTPRAHEVIQNTIQAARNLNLNYIGTEALLIGLSMTKECLAVQVLLNFGVTSEMIIEEIKNLLGVNSKPADAELAETKEWVRLHAWTLGIPVGISPTKQDIEDPYEIIKQLRETLADIVIVAGKALKTNKEAKNETQKES